MLSYFLEGIAKYNDNSNTVRLFADCVDARITFEKNVQKNW